MTARVLSLAIVSLVVSQFFTGLCGLCGWAYQTQVISAATQSQGSGRDQELAEATKLDSQVVNLYREGKYDEAISPAKRVLKIREKLLKADDPLLADSAGNVAAIYLAKQNFADAESFLKRALSIYEKNLEGNDLLLAKTLENLGHVHNSKSDSKKAEQLYLRALSIKEKALNANHEEISLSINRLIEFYVRDKQAPKAITLLQRLISAKEQQSGVSHNEVGLLLERMACVMHNNKQKTEAETAEARANHILYGAQAKAAKPISLTNEVFACKLIDNPRPDLRSALRGRSLSAGAIRMEVAVETDEAGNVITANYIGGNPAYKSAAEKAALSAKVRPTIVDGRAVRVGGVIIHQWLIDVRQISVPVTVRQ